MTLRVVIADDEDLIRTGLRIIIDSEPGLTVVGEAADGAAVLPVVREHRPDVVLMDVRMPMMDGIQATRLLVALPEPPKVVVVTTFENDDYVYEALQAGASGFLLKRTRPDDLVRAVRTVAGGDSLLFPSAIRALAARRQTARRVPGVGRLTAREGDVLRLMARGLSNGEIAADLVVSTETVKTHVGNVLAKLEARDRTQAVIAAYESGFVSPG
ncbi:response regulator transcription factor [Planomonospora venezuelensis]|uniref:DNA-binding NarL/FixJ family response regulator n=1 Tax=Planomonospora venezuelensis TaxID=1999 RepID=A0A841D9M1_PLAVE|nr:response regulator transcription factor [Planomonospora venezuelensis]MBB5966189.1 DNA-binding NarL/FixJ family response regulator [Planomonospora venezuelensis]GIN01966.1 DNA-binding response regulator [Planomonospora venezuelensis]